MYTRLSGGNGFLDVDNKAELQKLKEHESNLQYQASSIRHMISKIDESFFGPTSGIELSDDKKNYASAEVKLVKSTKGKTTSDRHGREESKRAVPFSSSSVVLANEETESPRITETQKYIQSLKDKRTSTIKDRIQERAQMLEKMEDMRQHALILARKKEADAIAQKFYLQKCRLRALRRLQANANHQLRLSYAIIRSNLNKQRKALSYMLVFLHNRCVVRAKGMAYALHVAWKRFSDEIVPQIKNRDWLFIQQEKADRHYRKAKIARLFSELSNTKSRRSSMYTKAKRGHQRIVWKRFMRCLRQHLQKFHQASRIADLVSKHCAKTLKKSPAFLIEGCRSFYQTRRQRSLKTARIIGTPLLSFLLSQTGDQLLHTGKAFQKLQYQLSKVQERISILEKGNKHYRQALFRQGMRVWKQSLARKYWYKTLPVTHPHQRQQKKGSAVDPSGVKVTGIRKLLNGGNNTNNSIADTGPSTIQKKIAGDRLFYHRVPCASLKNIFQKWRAESQEINKRQKDVLPQIQQQLFTHVTKQKRIPVKPETPIEHLTWLLQEQKLWIRLQQKLQHQQQLRSLTLRANDMIERTMIRSLKRFFTLLAHKVASRQSLIAYLRTRHNTYRRRTLQTLLQRLQANVRRQKLHRMGMRYFRACVYARFFQCLDERQKTKHQRKQIVKISPRHHRLLYLAFQQLRDRVRQKQRKISLIRTMRSRVYSDLLRRYLQLWTWRSARIAENVSSLKKGTRHFQQRAGRVLLKQWMTLVEERYARRARLRQAETVTLPNLAKFCLKEWKAVTENSLYYNVTQYQKGQMLWKTLIQRRFLHIWMENAEEIHELDDHIRQFQDEIQTPLRIKRALRLWQEYLLKKQTAKAVMEEGVMLAVRQDAKSVLREWQTHACVVTKEMHRKYDEGRIHYAFHAMKKGLALLQNFAYNHMCVHKSSRMADKYWLQERQYRPVLVHWQQMSKSSRQQRRLKKMVRLYRHAQGWMQWSQGCQRLNQAHNAAQQAMIIAKAKRVQVHVEMQSRFLEKLTNRRTYRQQKQQAKDFRAKQLLRKVFVRGFKVIWQQYNDAHAHEMQRAKTAFLHRQQRRKLHAWLVWKRLKKARRLFLLSYSQTRLLQKSVSVQWYRFFHLQVKKPQSQAMRKAKVLHQKLCFQRTLRLWRNFVGKRHRFLYAILPKYAATLSSAISSSVKLLALKNMAHNSANSGSKNSDKNTSSIHMNTPPVTAALFLTMLEAETWQRQRAVVQREKVDLANHHTGRRRINNTTTLMANSTAHANNSSVLLRRWMHSRQLTSTRAVARFWQQRVLLQRAFHHRWYTAYHQENSKPQQLQMKQAIVYHHHIHYSKALQQWMRLMSDQLRCLHNEQQAVIHHDVHRLRVVWRQLHSTCIEKARVRRIERKAFLLAQCRLAWDTWRQRSRTVGELLWQEVNSSSNNNNSNSNDTNAIPNSNSSNVAMNTKKGNAEQAEGTKKSEARIRMQIVKPLKTASSLSSSSSSKSQSHPSRNAPKSGSKASTSTATTVKNSASTTSKSERIEEIINRSGACAATLTRFYCLLLLRHPHKASLRLSTRRYQLTNLQTASDHYQQRLLLHHVRLWQQEAHRWAFHRHVLPVFHWQHCMQRHLRQWSSWRQEQQCQHQQLQVVAPQFHHVFHLQERVLPRWRRFRHLSKAFHTVQREVVTRNIWKKWILINRRRQKMRRILLWMGEREKYQKLSFAWREWVTDTRVERLVAQRVLSKNQVLLNNYWDSWRARHVQVLQPQRRRWLPRAIRAFDRHRRTHVFDQLLALLGRRYPQRDAVKTATRHHQNACLRNTLMNLLALRRNRVAENFRKKYAWRHVLHAFRLFRQRMRHGQTRCIRADVMVTRTTIHRWRRFADLSLAKKFVYGVLPVVHAPPNADTHTHTHNADNNNIGSSSSTAGSEKVKTGTKVSAKRQAAEASAVLAAAAAPTAVVDLLQQYSTYYWQMRQLQVLKRLQRRAEAKRVHARQLQSCETYHADYQLYQAFHTHWLSQKRRHQRIQKNTFVTQRYDQFLRLKRALRIWDVWTQLRPFVQDTKWAMALRHEKRRHCQRGLKHWLLFQRQRQRQRLLDHQDVEEAKAREQQQQQQQQRRIEHHQANMRHSRRSRSPSPKGMVRSASAVSEEEVERHDRTRGGRGGGEETKDNQAAEEWLGRRGQVRRRDPLLQQPANPTMSPAASTHGEEGASWKNTMNRSDGSRSQQSRSPSPHAMIY